MFNLGHVSINIIPIRMESFGKENMFRWSFEKIKGPDPKQFDHKKNKRHTTQEASHSWELVS
jgi:hypothetical protein